MCIGRFVADLFIMFPCRTGSDWVRVIEQYLATITEICQGNEGNLAVRFLYACVDDVKTDYVCVGTP